MISPYEEVGPRFSLDPLKHSPKEGHTPLLGGEAEGLACGLHHFSCSGFILEALGSKKFPQFVLFLRQD